MYNRILVRIKKKHEMKKRTLWPKQCVWHPAFDMVDVVVTVHTDNVTEPMPMTAGTGFHRYKHRLLWKTLG